MRTTKRALLGGLLALTMLATAAPAAFGSASEALPSASPEDWTAVEASCEGGAPCNYEIEGQFKLTAYGVTIDTCVLSLDGTVSAAGIVEFSEGLIMPGSVGCTTYGPTNFGSGGYWQGPICRYTGAEQDQYWQLLRPSFIAFGKSVKGNAFVHLVNASLEDESPLTVGSILVDTEIGTSSIALHANGESSPGPWYVEPAFAVSGNEDPCDWDFENLDAN
jgi:hypothetical protein